MKEIERAPVLEKSDYAKAAEILSSPEKSESVRKYNSEYYHWNELKYREDDRAPIWATMKTIRNGLSQRFSVCDIEFSYTAIPEFQELLYNIDRAQPGIGENGIFSVSSAMEEAIASSQIEGAVSTRENAKKMLRSGRKPRTRDERMIFNNYLAMEYIKKHTDEDLTANLILEMHRIVTEGTVDEKYAGRFRDTDDVVVGDDDGNVFHTPPSHEKIEELINGLCDFANSKEFIHPMVKASMLHFLVGFIHPFADGNGRLARSLFYWCTLKNGYTIMEYTSISRIVKKSLKKYGLAYRYSETDDNDLTYFIKYSLECVSESIDELRKYITRKTRERCAVYEAMDVGTGLTVGEMMILGDYSVDMFSIREISSRYSMSYQSARNHVLHLLDNGYIRASGKNRKTVMYSVSRK